MITFVSAVVRAIAAGDTPSLAVETDDGHGRIAEVPLPLGDVSVNDVVLLADTRVDVDIRHIEMTMALGVWPVDADDPAGPLGLAATPVIVVPDARWIDLATAGAVRAGRAAVCRRLPGDGPALGLQMLIAVTEGADVVLVEGGGGAHLRLARALGGRPLPALPLSDPVAVSMMLRGCDLDVEVPVPTLEEPQRGGLRLLLRSLALERAHHVVEVDPAPAFAEAGLPMHQAPLEALAAGAAGVLAGRLAAGNRRWRAQLDA